LATRRTTSPGAFPVVWIVSLCVAHDVQLQLEQYMPLLEVDGVLIVWTIG
jgi:hypothetical protein